MKVKKVLVFAAVLAIFVLGSAGAAFADILVTFPPNPFEPPPEAVYLVNQTAPVDVLIFFQNIGSPNVFYPSPSPPR